MQNSPRPRNRLAIDVGGTFVDFVFLDEESGEITLEKQFSTPARIVEEISEGIKRLPCSLDNVGRIFHGTTVALNTIIQETGAKMGLLTTRGFRDVLEVGRGGRPEIYNPRYEAPACLVPRYLRREVLERIGAQGEVIVPLSIEDLDRKSDLLVEDGCEAIAICFLHSYKNNEHERVAAARIRDRHPSLAVSVSHELVNEWREFERTSTTVLNAYVQPQFEKYVKSIRRQLESDGYQSALALMQSNGGVVSADRAAARPVTTLESGPAGGVIGAQALSQEMGIDNLICFDVGGTTVDVALIDGGRIVERAQTEVARRPVMGSTIDISSVGAGGGSIAWIDPRGALRVGPQSAGSLPGSVCFGRGGTELTVTDCHLLLGRLDPDTFLGSRLKLDLETTQEVAGLLAEKLNLSIEETALGVIKIATTNLTHAIRGITVERGLDPRDYSILSYGGGGALFAAFVGEELQVKSVVIPRAPANFSAWGILTSDYREDNSRTLVMPFTVAGHGKIVEVFNSLKNENIQRLQTLGFDAEDLCSTARADIRFAGQEFTVTVPFEEDWLRGPDELMGGVRRRFVDLHNRLYGHGDFDAPLEIVTLRVQSVGGVERPSWPEWDNTEIAKPVAVRNTCFESGDGHAPVPVFHRVDLALGQRIHGPAIIEEWANTIVIPPNWILDVDRLGNLVLKYDQ